MVRIWDQRRLILPINYFIEQPFQNWTRQSSELLGTVFFYLDYSVPVHILRDEFSRLLANDPLWDKRVAAIQMTDAKESSVEIRALLSAKNSSEIFDLRCNIREGMIDFIQKNYPGSLPKQRTALENKNKPDEDNSSELN